MATDSTTFEVPCSDQGSPKCEIYVEGYVLLSLANCTPDVEERGGRLDLNGVDIEPAHGVDAEHFISVNSKELLEHEVDELRAAGSFWRSHEYVMRDSCLCCGSSYEYDEEGHVIDD